MENYPRLINIHLPHTIYSTNNINCQAQVKKLTTKGLNLFSVIIILNLKNKEIKMKIALINHGCAKNLIDSELMLGLLCEKGYEITLDETQAPIIIVNTCSFIHDAEEESVRSILSLTNAGKVIVAGCFTTKTQRRIKKAIPEIVAMVGTTDFSSIVEIVDKIAACMEENSFEEINDCISENTYISNISKT